MRPGTKALIIDDESEICYLLSRILRKRSIAVDCAGSLSEARMRLKSYSPSIIFIDNNLPDGLGIQFVEYLRALFPETKLVIITGQEIASGDISYPDDLPPVILKPFTSEKIYSIIEEIF